MERCGKCPNCLVVERCKKQMLAICRPTGKGHDDGTVAVWNDTLRDYPCRPLIGYDGKHYGIGDRVEVHPGTDLWMQGARFGEVVGTSPTPKDRVHVKLDKLTNIFGGTEDTFRRID